MDTQNKQFRREAILKNYDFNDAVKARKLAEEKYFLPFLEELKEQG